MRARGKKHIQTRREVGHILRERDVAMSANEIADALKNRTRRTVQANPIKVAQLLRGAKGVGSTKEVRQLDSSRQEVKIYKMDNYDDYNNWLNGER